MLPHHLSLVVGTSLLALGTVACSDAKLLHGSGVAATEERKLPPYSVVQLDGPGELAVRPGEQHVIRITTDDNLLSNIGAEIQSPLLTISAKTNHVSRIGLKAVVVLPRLAGLAVNGDGFIAATGFASTNLLVRVTGAGRIRVHGTALRLDAKISGAGTIEAGELEARDAEVNVTGAGNVLLHATNSLTARIVGEGVVRHRGKPASIRQSITGAGRLLPWKSGAGSPGGDGN